MDPGNGWGLEGGRQGCLPKGLPLPPPPLGQPTGQELYIEEWGYMQTQHSSPLTFTLKLVISGLTGIIFIVLSTMNLQFQDWLVSISLSFWNCGSFISWLWSGLHIVNFYHLGGGFSIYKTEYGLRILSVALEEEPKVLIMLTLLLLDFDCLPLFLHFLTFFRLNLLSCQKFSRDKDKRI